MTAEDNAGGSGEAANGPKSKDQVKAPSKEQTGSNNAAAGEKKLSNAELKKKAKEEKAARRAQAKSTQSAPHAAPLGPQGTSGDGKAGPKGKPNNPKAGGLPVPSHHRAASRTNLPPVVKEAPKSKIPECFGHLSMAKRITISQADKDVHPVVLVVGQHMSTFSIRDSITRLESTLLAFKKVIDSYTTPHGNTLSRHFTSHVLKPQIEYLTECRPMCFSMGNAIRWLKLQISKIDIDLSDIDAKKLLCQSIDGFIRQRIVLAAFVIVERAVKMMGEDEVILVYAHDKLVERTLLHAKSSGKEFGVILVDDSFDRVGIEHAKTLTAAGIFVKYVADLGVLRISMREATMVLLAAEAMFGNGAMYARAGTADIAAAAMDLQKRVVTLSEAINFTERVAIDSLTYNEIDPERCTDEKFRLLFDTTHPKFISDVVTELGDVTALSLHTILTKLEEL